MSKKKIQKIHEAFEGDLEQLRDLIQGALKKDLESSGEDDWWPQVHALFDDNVVVEMKDGRLLKYPYTVDKNTPALGAPVEVVKTFEELQENEPFLVNGVPLMYPRDPVGPPAEAINCGCVQLPIMESWDVKQPGRQAFSNEEQVKNPIKRGLARELNPVTEVGSVTALGGLSQAAARQQIAQYLAGEDFAAFVNRVDGPADYRPLAVLQGKYRKALGAKTGIVRLSSYTVAKQRAHRRGQGFTTADYRRVQDMLDKGLILKDGPRKIHVFRKGQDGKIWQAVLKTTRDENEIYMVTLHRADSRRLSSTVKKLEMIRKEK